MLNFEEKETLILKIQKLFALSGSSNQHEAELALQKANELMEQYQISATEVDLKETGVVGEAWITKERLAKWKWLLGAAAARLYDGDCIKGRRGVFFIGCEKDLPLMQATYDYLLRSWNAIVEHDGRDYKGKINMRSYKNSHGIGFQQAIAKRVKELVENRKANVSVASVTGRELILVKNQVLAEELKKRGIKTRNVSIASVNGLAYADGKSAGENIPLGGANVKTSPQLLAA